MPKECVSTQDFVCLLLFLSDSEDTMQCVYVCVVIVCGTDSFPCIQVLTQQMVPESGQFHISAASFASLLLERPLALIECSESASSAC